MQFSKRLPAAAYALIVILLVLTFLKPLLEVGSGRRQCLTAYDGFGYYMYLPAVATQGSLKMHPEWAKKLQENYCSGVPVYQLIPTENGNFLDIYHMGLAVVEAPSFFIAHLIAKAGGYPADGMSKPYHCLFIVNALLFALLGVYYLRKLLLLFFPPGVCALVVLLIFGATNYWVTATKSFDLQHLYLFTLVTALFYFLISYQRTGRGIWRAALLLGLVVLIRPTHLLLAVFPVMLLYTPENKKKWLKEVLLFGGVGFLCQLPQLFYWKLVGGHWLIPNLHTENLVLSSPHLTDFLFSYRKGWLLYTPLFLLLIPGFVLMRKHFSRLSFAIMVFLVLDIWVVSSWDCWWYAGSFGQRPMVDVYGILAVPLGFAFVRHNSLRILPVFFGAAVFVLAIIQTVQYNNGIISPDRMTREQYWAVFGQIHPTNFSDARLLLDRSDVDWPGNFGKFATLGYGKRVKRISPAGNIDCPPNGYTQIAVIEPMKLVATDEVNIEATCNYTLQSTGSAELLMEMISRGKTYQWNKLMMNGGAETSSVKFNLPDIRDGADQLNIVVHNPTADTLHFKKLVLTTTELLREKR